MLPQKLREQVLEANLELVRRGLVLYTFGNASSISREDGPVAIKPSGVAYDQMRPEHLVITDLEGKMVEGKLNPSSDLPSQTRHSKDGVPRSPGLPTQWGAHYACITPSYHATPGYEPSSGSYDWTQDANQRWVAAHAQSRRANLFEAVSTPLHTG